MFITVTITVTFFFSPLLSLKVTVQVDVVEGDRGDNSREHPAPGQENHQAFICDLASLRTAEGEMRTQTRLWTSV